MMTASVLGLAATYTVLTWLSGVESLYVLGLVQGMVMAACELSMMVYLMSIIPEGRTGMVMGLYSEAENVGAIIASPFFGYLYDNMGPEKTVMALAGILSVNAFIAWSTIKNVGET